MNLPAEAADATSVAIMAMTQRRQIDTSAIKTMQADPIATRVVSAPMLLSSVGKKCVIRFNTRAPKRCTRLSLSKFPEIRGKRPV